MRLSLLQPLSLNQSFPGATAWIIGAGEIIQGIFINQPGIMEFIGREVTLAAQALDRFRVNF